MDRVVSALAHPGKPDFWLAERLGITDRGARFILDGKRRVTARVLLVVMSELA